MQRLAGKAAVVTGAARGIGAETARLFAAEGAHVLLADLEGKAADATAAAIRKAKGKALGVMVDVGDPDDVARLFETAEAELGRLDILVANAGIARVVRFLDHPLHVWERTLRVNLTGVFLCGQTAARLMIASKAEGSIINIASISGQRGGTGRAAYGASKAGVIGLTKVMAVELAKEGIRVNAIAPGPVETDMTRRGHTPESREAYHRLTPQRRYGSELDIAQAALYLASDESGYVTGHTLNVDGGFGAAGLMIEDLAAAAKPAARGRKPAR
jgi:3-oxoacyl-[acyl-carrier protein] reductase